MEEYARKAILLALLDKMKRNGSWCGETHFQKSVYFLQEGLGVPLELRFILYKHGPYSFDLDRVLGEMHGSYLVRQEVRGSYGPSLVVDEPGERLMMSFPKTIDGRSFEIAFVAERISARSVVELERIGTALYVRNKHPDFSSDEQVRRIVELKPHITLDQASDAVLEISKLLDEAARRGPSLATTRTS